MTRIPVSIHVNGRQAQAAIEPRTLLADFLRDEQRLTGLHLACEHGVCGACNVTIDGRLSRSCTALAASCDGSRVETIEGYDGDPLMQRLREAFSAEHALQCGYCTPGMLMAARDIVLRFPRASEADVRRELAGNLCRCTGYAGIVRAILRVVDSGIAAELRAVPGAAVPAACATGLFVLDAPAVSTSAPVRPVPLDAPAGPPAPAVAGDMTTIARSFDLPLPRAAVWAFFGDLRRVASCMPGMVVDDVVDGQRVRGTFTVKVGPIRAAFATQASVTRDEQAASGRVTSEGRDRITRSTATSQLDYRVADAADGQGSTVHVCAAFRISGRLAEFSRSEIVAALADQLTARFAANVAQHLAAADGARPAPAATALEIPLWQTARQWLAGRLASLRGAGRRGAARKPNDSRP